MKKLLYYGCIREKGHNLFDTDGYSTAPRESLFPVKFNLQILKVIDGSFCPCNPMSQRYNECIVPPLRIVAWWDYSIDQRPGSNSNLIGYGYESAEEMIDDAFNIFPSVMKRQTRPIKS